MHTIQEIQGAFERLRPALEEQAASGAHTVVSWVRSLEDPVERAGVYLLARQALVLGDGPHRDLDIAVSLHRTCVEDLLTQAESAADPDSRGWWTNLVNVASYNLAADLAHCWPDDGLVRERHHFEAGLAAAEECIRWRMELGRGPGPLSMAWWAKGMHSLSLGDTRTATEAWERASLLAAEADLDRPTLLLMRGYAALGHLIQHRGDADKEYAAVLSELGESARDPGMAEAALSCVEQLTTVRSRYMG